jgi:hypothetical protein
MPVLANSACMQLLGALGAAAVLFGSIVALRQKGLKLLIAFSTVAQFGYLFLMFPLAFDPATGKLASGGALAGGILQALSHATPIGRFPPANSLALEALARALWLLIPGSALARALGSWDQHSAPFGMVVLIAALSPARRGDLAFGRLIEQVDGMLRQWPAACVSLLVVALLLGAALMAAR